MLFDPLADVFHLKREVAHYFTWNPSTLEEEKKIIL